MRIALWPQSMRSRLMLVMVAGLAAALVVGSVVVWWDRGRYMRQVNVDHYVERVAAAVRVVDGTAGARREDVLRVMDTPRFRVAELPSFPSADEVRVAETEQSREIEARLAAELDGRQVLFRMTELPGAGQWPPRRRFLERRMHPPPLGLVAVVALDDGTALRFSDRLFRHGTHWPVRLLVSTIILLAAALLLAALAVRLVVRPLRRVAVQAEEIGRDLDTAQMPETGPTEVRRVAAAMNAMQRRLRHLFDERTRFLAAVSHDLRTPITRMRLRTELIEDDELRVRMERDLEEMERMVQQTLEFMRDAGAREAPRRIDLVAMLEALVEDLAEQGATVVFEPGERIVIESRPLALKRCVDNLVSNALRYGTRVELTAAVTPGGVRIEVLDDGPGIPEAELERVFEPFYRLDKARADGGTGLGLSIARAIAESLGGALTLHNREPRGLAARLELPRGAA